MYICLQLTTRTKVASHPENVESEAPDNEKKIPIGQIYSENDENYGNDGILKYGAIWIHW